MAYTLEDQFRRDIDWFFKDTLGRIFHVASAGGILPKEVAENDRRNSGLNKIFRTLSPNFEVILNPSLREIIGYQDESDRSLSLYTQDFNFYAERGIFSYDKSILGAFEDTFYHLVAKPRNGFLNINELTNSNLINRIPLIEGRIDIEAINSFDFIDYFNFE
jgi:hypothetical protein